MTEPEPLRRSSPRRGLLLVLKRLPGASLAEIAANLGVSKVAALGHLRGLEEEGLVERSSRAGKVGRPQAVFRLTPAAAALFPHSYADMSICALEFIDRRLGRPAIRELLAERAQEVAAKNRSRIPRAGLGARVEELARIRTEGGYMAEVGPRRSGSVEMLEHNCPILALAQKFPEACDVERRMFESLLEAQVDVSHRVVAGDPVCRFLVRGAKARA